MSKNQKILILILAILLIATLFVLFELLKIEKATASISPLFNAPSDYISLTSQRLQDTQQQSLTLIWNDQQILIEPKERTDWLEQYERRYTKRIEVRPNYDTIGEYIKQLSVGINTQPINARFALQDSELIETHVAINGIEVDIENSVRNISKALLDNSQTSSLKLNEVEPEINLENLKKLGITTLIGKGTSDFGGSAWSRIENIKVGSEKLNGILVMPGEEFSFNDRIGPITISNGFKYGQIISGNEIRPDVGGGVCQISTTVFRAAIDTGLPITERRGHSLPVRFYNPQGFDATIYQGVQDLKFTNDYQSPILIQSYITGNILTFEFYGKDDQRVVEYNSPVAYGYDGEGGFKTVFRRTITKNDGTETSESFYTSYRSPNKFEVVRNPYE